MKSLSLILIAVVGMTMLLMQACTKDVLRTSTSESCDESDPVAYEDVKQILTGSCGASSNSCHSPGGQPPDYTSLNPGMEASLIMQRFENEVLIKGSMPKQGWPQLDSTELKMIKCWVEGGYLR